MRAGKTKFKKRNRQIKRGKKYADNMFFLYPRGLGVCDQMMMVNFLFHFSKTKFWLKREVGIPLSSSQDLCSH